MQFPRVVEWWGKERPPCIIGTSVTKEFDVMEMVCQLPCLSILQTPWGHDLDENSLQASSILKPPCLHTNAEQVELLALGRQLAVKHSKARSVQLAG